jgi:predicted signal transduction protein with EAL and GGDEF domain
MSPTPTATILGRTLFDLYPEEERPGSYLTGSTDLINGEEAAAASERVMRTRTKGRCIVQMTKIVVRDREQRPQFVISLIEDITERKNSESKIEHLAHYDALTSLANRNLFRERIDETLGRLHRAGESFAVFLLELDRLKAVTDRSVTRPATSCPLRSPGGSCRSFARPIRRLGVGDEFA